MCSTLVHQLRTNHEAKTRRSCGFRSRKSHAGRATESRILDYLDKTTFKDFGLDTVPGIASLAFKVFTSSEKLQSHDPTSFLICVEVSVIAEEALRFKLWVRWAPLPEPSTSPLSEWAEVVECLRTATFSTFKKNALRRNKDLSHKILYELKVLTGNDDEFPWHYIRYHMVYDWRWKTYRTPLASRLCLRR
jgi:hypothetical protein